MWKTSYLYFLVFGAQEAGACHGQVYPQHAEEQQAAHGPQGGHGVRRAWRRDGSQAVGPPQSPCTPELAGGSPAGRVRGCCCRVEKLFLPLRGAPSAHCPQVGENYRIRVLYSPAIGQWDSPCLSQAAAGFLNEGSCRWTSRVPGDTGLGGVRPPLCSDGPVNGQKSVSQTHKPTHKD